MPQYTGQVRLNPIQSHVRALNVNSAVILGSGPYVDALHFSLSQQGVIVLPASTKNLETCVTVLPLFIESALRERARLFQKCATEAKHVCPLRNPTAPLAEIMQTLREANGAKDSFTEELLLNPMSASLKLELETLFHDYKYLYLPTSHPSSWFFRSPFQTQAEHRASFHARVLKTRASIARINILLGSRAETLWFSSLQLFVGWSLHQALALDLITSSDPALNPIRSLIPQPALSSLLTFLDNQPGSFDALATERPHLFDHLVKLDLRNENDPTATALDNC